VSFVSRTLAVRVALGVIVVACASWQARHLGTYLHDDTFISLRYARALAGGEGLVFNPGERVEGYTNFLWTVVLAACTRIGLDAVWWAGVLSSSCWLLLVLRVGWFGARHAPARAWALPAPLLLSLHPLARAESVGGLESTLFALLLWFGFEALSDPAARRGRVGAAFGIAMLVRPEAAGLFIVAMLVRLRHGWRALVPEIVVFAALVLPHLCFRLAYYGDWVPNTFHAKVAWSAAQAARGARYAWESGVGILGIAVLAVVAIGFGCGWRGWAAGLAAAHTVFVVAVGGDFAPTGRFLLPGLAFVLLLLQSGLWRIRATLGEWRVARATLPLVLVALAAVQIARAGQARLQARSWETMYPYDLVARRELGEALRAHYPAATRLAVGSVGAIGYYSQLPILDTFGLTDAEIARLKVPWMGRASAGHEKGDAEVLFRRAPELIVFDRGFIAPRAMTWEEFLGRARSPTELLLVEDPRLPQQYSLRTLPAGNRTLHFLERIAP
jgi:hypothetical protein